MIAEHIRDASATAVVFGLFGSGWFGWAQESPPRRWPPILGLGSMFSLLTAAVGGILTWQRWSDPTAFDADTSRSFGVVVGIEFGAAALGAVLLALRRRRDLIPVWVALVVGLHLFPVAALIDYPLVHVVAALVTAVALAAVPLARARGVAVSAVVGLGTGAVLLAGAVSSLLIALVAY
ncbi:hypothetical protein ACWENR_09460 [Micromonospora sp. NPDC004336]